MKISRALNGSLCIGLAWVILSAVAIQPATAADQYPSKPIELVVPFGPGSATDLAGRAISTIIPKYIGQSVLVVNKPGAGGATGAYDVIKSKPDGYTVLMGGSGSNGVTPALNPKLGYKYDEFSNVAMTQVNPLVFVVRSNSPWKNIAELIDYMKKNPRKVRYNYSPGLDQLAPEQFLKVSGVDRKTQIGVPCESAKEGVLAVIQNTVDWSYSVATPAVPFIKEGRLRALAVSTEQRMKSLPDVPTLAEAGYGEASLVGWRGIFGPPKLPENVVAKWNEALRALMKDNAYLSILDRMGDIPFYKDPKDTKAYVDRMHTVYSKIGEEVGLTVK